MGIFRKLVIQLPWEPYLAYGYDGGTYHSILGHDREELIRRMRGQMKVWVLAQRSEEGYALIEHGGFERWRSWALRRARRFLRYGILQASSHRHWS